MAKIVYVHLFLAMATIQHWPLDQLDIKNTFLHGELQEEAYMDQTPSFTASSKSRLVCQVYHSLYSLK